MSTNRMFGFRNLGFGSIGSPNLIIEIADFTITGSGSMDITTANLNGRTPFAAMFFVNRATTWGTPAADAGMSRGAFDGTNEFCHVSNDEDGASGGNTDRLASDQDCIGLVNSAGSFETRAQGTSFIAGGVRINVSTYTANRVGYAVLFAGSGYAAAGTFDPHDTATNDITVSGLGITPTLVFTFGCSVPYDESSDTDGTRWSFGFSDGTTRHCIARDSDEAATTGQAMRINTSNDLDVPARALVDSVGAGYTHSFAEGEFQFRTVTGSASVLGAYLALEIQASIAIGSKQTPTSTGDDAVYGLGFEPQAVIGAITTNDTLNTFQSVSPESEGASIFAATANNERSVGVAADDDLATSDTYSLPYNAMMRVDDGSAATAVQASLSSLDEDGFTPNFSAVETTDTPYYIYCAIGK